MSAPSKVSPLAPDRFPDLPPVAGVRLAARACGIRYQGRADVMLAELAPGTAMAGVFTRSRTAAAPVEWCRQAAAGGAARALVVNSGNANAFNGMGLDAVRRTAAATAALFGCPETEVFVASTGVIGEPLPVERITGALAALRDDLAPGAWEAAERAIMTTDTFPKGAVRTATIGGVPVTVVGICKGSGMIAPNMGTMLGFVFTDAAVPGPVLRALLGPSVDRSFNAITVDGDTSTSDTVLLFATGVAGPHPVPAGPDDPVLTGFRDALDSVLLDLAHQVVKDGEGATKFVTIRVEGAESVGAARRIALTVANSPLVKTAIAGEDANWGRIVAAVGRAGEDVDRSRLGIAVGGHPVAAGGAPVPGYDERPVADHMKGHAIDIRIDIGLGGGAATVWTCDLTYEYIRINADYRS